MTNHELHGKLQSFQLQVFFGFKALWLSRFMMVSGFRGLGLREGLWLRG